MIMIRMMILINIEHHPGIKLATLSRTSPFRASYYFTIHMCNAYGVSNRENTTSIAFTCNADMHSWRVTAVCASLQLGWSAKRYVCKIWLSKNKQISVQIQTAVWRWLAERKTSIIESINIHQYTDCWLQRFSTCVSVLTSRSTCSLTKPSEIYRWWKQAWSLRATNSDSYCYADI